MTDSTSDFYDEIQSFIHTNNPSRRIDIIGYDSNDNEIGRIDVLEKYIAERRYDVISRAMEILKNKNKYITQYHLGENKLQEVRSVI